MAENQKLLTPVVDLFGFAELTGEICDVPTPCLSQTQWSSGNPDTTSVENQTLAHRRDDNEIVVPILSDRSGLTKYKVLARLKPEEDEVAKPPSHKDIFITSDKGSPKGKSQTFAIENSVSVIPEQKNVHDGLKKRPDFKPKASSKDKGKAALNITKTVKDNTKTSKMCKPMKLKQKCKVLAKIRDKEKELRKQKTKSQPKLCEDSHTSMPGKMEEKDRLQTVKKSESETRTEETACMKGKDKTEEPVVNLSEKSDIVRKASEVLDKGEGLCSLRNELDNLDSSNSMLQGFMVDSGTNLENTSCSNCESMDLTISEQDICQSEGERDQNSSDNSYIESAQPLNKCFVSLERCPSSEDLPKQLLDNSEHSRPEKKRKVSCEIETKMKRFTNVSRQSSDSGSSICDFPYQVSVKRKKSSDEKTAMIYNTNIDVRKSGRLKSAKCASRYRGDYGIRADIYNKITCKKIENNSEKNPSVTNDASEMMKTLYDASLKEEPYSASPSEQSVQRCKDGMESQEVLSDQINQNCAIEIISSNTKLETSTDSYSSAIESSGISEQNSLVPCSELPVNSESMYNSDSTVDGCKSNLVISLQNSEGKIEYPEGDLSQEDYSQDSFQSVIGKAGYVHSVGKSVNKKQKYISKRSTFESNEKEIFFPLSPDSSPEICDTSQLLEKLRCKMFEQVGLSAQEKDAQPKQFESKLISSKLKERLFDSSQGTNTVNSVTREQAAIPKSFYSCIDYHKSPLRCSTPTIVSSTVSILDEVAEKLNTMQSKRKNEGKQSKPKRQRFQEKKFMLRSMCKLNKTPGEIQVEELNNSLHEEDSSSLIGETTDSDIFSNTCDDTDVRSVDESFTDSHKTDFTKVESDVIVDKVKVKKVCKGKQALKQNICDVLEKNIVKRKPKSVKCHACCQTFRSKEIMRKHYPCRVRQTRTWSQNKLRPNRVFRNDNFSKKKANLNAKLSKSGKRNNKSRPQLLTPRKTKFRRVKGKRRRRLHQLIQELMSKRQIMDWPHLNVLYTHLSFKEQCLYRLGLFCVGKKSEGLERYSEEDQKVFREHQDKEKAFYFSRNYKHIFPSSDDESRDSVSDSKEVCDTLNNVPSANDTTEFIDSFNTCKEGSLIDCSSIENYIQSSYTENCSRGKCASTLCELSNNGNHTSITIIATGLSVADGFVKNSESDEVNDAWSVVGETLENIICEVVKHSKQNATDRNSVCAEDQNLSTTKDTNNVIVDGHEKQTYITDRLNASHSDEISMCFPLTGMEGTKFNTQVSRMSEKNSSVTSNLGKCKLSSYSQITQKDEQCYGNLEGLKFQEHVEQPKVILDNIKYDMSNQKNGDMTMRNNENDVTNEAINSDFELNSESIKDLPLSELSKIETDTKIEIQMNDLADSVLVLKDEGISFEKQKANSIEDLNSEIKGLIKEDSTVYNDKVVENDIDYDDQISTLKETENGSDFCLSNLENDITENCDIDKLHENSSENSREFIHTETGNNMHKKYEIKKDECTSGNNFIEPSCNNSEAVNALFSESDCTDSTVTSSPEVAAHEVIEKFYQISEKIEAYMHNSITNDGQHIFTSFETQDHSDFKQLSSSSNQNKLKDSSLKTGLEQKESTCDRKLDFEDRGEDNIERFFELSEKLEAYIQHSTASHEDNSGLPSDKSEKEKSNLQPKELFWATKYVSKTDNTDIPSYTGKEHFVELSSNGEMTFEDNNTKMSDPLQDSTKINRDLEANTAKMRDVDMAFNKKTLVPEDFDSKSDENKLLHSSIDKNGSFLENLNVFENDMTSKKHEIFSDKESSTSIEKEGNTSNEDEYKSIQCTSISQTDSCSASLLEMQDQKTEVVLYLEQDLSVFKQDSTSVHVDSVCKTDQGGDTKGYVYKENKDLNDIPKENIKAMDKNEPLLDEHINFSESRKGGPEEFKTVSEKLPNDKEEGNELIVKTGIQLNFQVENRSLDDLNSTVNGKDSIRHEYSNTNEDCFASIDNKTSQEISETDIQSKVKVRTMENADVEDNINTVESLKDETNEKKHSPNGKENEELTSKQEKQINSKENCLSNNVEEGFELDYDVSTCKGNDSPIERENIISMTEVHTKEINSGQSWSDVNNDENESMEALTDCVIPITSSPIIKSCSPKAPAVIKYKINGVYFSENLETGVKEVITDEYCVTDINIESSQENEVCKDENSDINNDTLEYESDTERDLSNCKTKEIYSTDDIDITSEKVAENTSTCITGLLHRNTEHESTKSNDSHSSPEDSVENSSILNNNCNSDLKSDDQYSKSEWKEIIDDPKDNDKDSISSNDSSYEEHKGNFNTIDEKQSELSNSTVDEIEIMRSESESYIENNSIGPTLLEEINSDSISIKDDDQCKGLFQKIGEDDINFLQTEPPPILEKEVEDTIPVKVFTDQTGVNMKFESGPPILEPVKRPRVERHFLDIIGEIYEKKNDSDVKVSLTSKPVNGTKESFDLRNKLHKNKEDLAVTDSIVTNGYDNSHGDTLPDNSTEFSYREDIGRHFSDVIDASCAEKPQLSEIQMLFDKSEKGDVTLAQIRSLLSPNSKKGIEIPMDSLLKIRSGVENIISKVKLPTKKDPAWLKRDALLNYESREDTGGRCEAVVLNSDADKDPVLVKETENPVDEHTSSNFNSDSTSVSITDSILQMLTSLEDKGSFAENMTNLLHILAENLGFSRSNSDSNEEYLCTKGVEKDIISNNRLSLDDFESQLLEIGDEPPPLDEISFGLSPFSGENDESDNFIEKEDPEKYLNTDDQSDFKDGTFEEQISVHGDEESDDNVLYKSESIESKVNVERQSSKIQTLFKSITELNSIETDDDSESEEIFDVVALSQRMSELKSISKDAVESEVFSDIEECFEEELEIPCDQNEEKTCSGNFGKYSSEKIMSEGSNKDKMLNEAQPSLSFQDKDLRCVKSPEIETDHKKELPELKTYKGKEIFNNIATESCVKESEDKYQDRNDDESVKGYWSNQNCFDASFISGDYGNSSERNTVSENLCPSLSNERNLLTMENNGKESKIFYDSVDQKEIDVEQNSNHTTSNEDEEFKNKCRSPEDQSKEDMSKENKGSGQDNFHETDEEIISRRLSSNNNMIVALGEALLSNSKNIPNATSDNSIKTSEEKAIFLEEDRILSPVRSINSEGTDQEAFNNLGANFDSKGEDMEGDHSFVKSQDNEITEVNKNVLQEEESSDHSNQDDFDSEKEKECGTDDNENQFEEMKEVTIEIEESVFPSESSIGFITLDEVRSKSSELKKEQQSDELSESEADISDSMSVTEASGINVLQTDIDHLEIENDGKKYDLDDLNASGSNEKANNEHKNDINFDKESNNSPNEYLAPLSKSCYANQMSNPVADQENCSKSTSGKFESLVQKPVQIYCDKSEKNTYLLYDKETNNRGKETLKELYGISNLEHNDMLQNNCTVKNESSQEGKSCKSPSFNKSKLETNNEQINVSEDSNTSTEVDLVKDISPDVRTLDEIHEDEIIQHATSYIWKNKENNNQVNRKTFNVEIESSLNVDEVFRNSKTSNSNHNPNSVDTTTSAEEELNENREANDMKERKFETRDMQLESTMDINKVEKPSDNSLDILDKTALKTTENEIPIFVEEYTVVKCVDEDSNDTVVYETEASLITDQKQTSNVTSFQGQTFNNEEVAYSWNFGGFCETIAEKVKRKQKERLIKLDQARSRYRTFSQPKNSSERQKEFSVFRKTMLQTKANRSKKRSLTLEENNQENRKMARSTSVPKDTYLPPCSVVLDQIIDSITEKKLPNPIDLKPCSVKLERLDQETVDRYTEKVSEVANFPISRPPIRFKISLKNLCVKPCSPRPSYISDAASGNSSGVEESESEYSDDFSEKDSVCMENDEWIQAAQYRMYEIKNSPRTFHRSLEERKPIKIKVKSITTKEDGGDVSEEIVEENFSEKVNRSLSSAFDEVLLQQVPSPLNETTGNDIPHDIVKGESPVKSTWIKDLRLSDSDSTDIESDKEEAINQIQIQPCNTENKLDRSEETIVTAEKSSKQNAVDKGPCLENISAMELSNLEINNFSKTISVELQDQTNESEEISNNENIIKNMDKNLQKDSIVPEESDLSCTLEKTSDLTKGLCMENISATEVSKSDITNYSKTISIELQDQTNESGDISNDQNIIMNSDKNLLKDSILPEESGSPCTLDKTSDLISTMKSGQPDTIEKSLSHSFSEDEHVSADDQADCLDNITDREAYESTGENDTTSKFLEADERHLTIENNVEDDQTLNVSLDLSMQRNYFEQKSERAIDFNADQIETGKEEEVNQVAQTVSNDSFVDGERRLKTDESKGNEDLPEIGVETETNMTEENVITESSETQILLAMNNEQCSLTKNVNIDSSVHAVETSQDSEFGKMLGKESSDLNIEESGVNCNVLQEQGCEVGDERLNRFAKDLERINDITELKSTNIQGIELDKSDTSDILSCDKSERDGIVDRKNDNNHDGSATEIEDSCPEENLNELLGDQLNEIIDNGDKIKRLNEMEQELHSVDKFSLERENNLAVLSLEDINFKKSYIPDIAIEEGDEIIYYAVEVNDDYETNEAVSNIEQFEQERIIPDCEQVAILETCEIQTNIVESMAVEGYEIQEGNVCENVVDISEANEIVEHEEIIPGNEIEASSSEMTDISCVAMVETQNRFLCGINEDSQSSQELIEECVMDFGEVQLQNDL